jgi:hypothetical protein
VTSTDNTADVSPGDSSGDTPARNAVRRSPLRAFVRWTVITVASLVAIFVLVITAVETVQAYAVRFGAGQAGSFSSTSQTCDYRGNCIWTGTFTGANGTTQNGVTFEDGGHQGTASAVDVPATYLWGSAYPADGGGDWFAYTIFVFLELVAVYFGIHFWRRARRRRRAARQPETAAAVGRP